MKIYATFGEKEDWTSNLDKYENYNNQINQNMAVKNLNNYTKSNYATKSDSLVSLPADKLNLKSSAEKQAVMGLTTANTAVRTDMSSLTSAHFESYIKLGNEIPIDFLVAIYAKAFLEPHSGIREVEMNRAYAQEMLAMSGELFILTSTNNTDSVVIESASPRENKGKNGELNDINSNDIELEVIGRRGGVAGVFTGQSVWKRAYFELVRLTIPIHRAILVYGNKRDVEFAIESSNFSGNKHVSCVVLIDKVEEVERKSWFRFRFRGTDASSGKKMFYELRAVGDTDRHVSEAKRWVCVLKDSQRLYARVDGAVSSR